MLGVSAGDWMTDDALQMLRDARQAARRGAHAEALGKYLWFHHHALEHSPALAGVRLSYAISGVGGTR